MSFGRRQLPVFSPLPTSALIAAMLPGDRRSALAESLRATYDAREVVLTSSGTAALTLALLAASQRRPDAPCVLPAYACYDLVTAAVGAGVRVLLYDVDPRTLAPQPESLARALAHGAAALVVVHLFGVPVPMVAMRATAERSGALLIEDAAQATGGSWRGRPLGSHGDFGILSFGRGKGETGGGGGALLIHGDTALPDAVRGRIDTPIGAGPSFLLKLAAQWSLGRPSLYALPASVPQLRLGETIYRDPVPARGMRTASARVLMRTRPRSRTEAEVRRAHALRFRLALGARADEIAVRVPDDGEPGWLRFPIRLPVPSPIAVAGERLGIVEGYPLPLHEVPALAPLLSGATDAPEATRLSRTIRTLPTHSRLSEADLLAIERWIAEALESAPPNA